MKLSGVKSYSAIQRVLNDLQRTRLSRHRIISFGSPPLSSAIFFSVFLCVVGWWERGGGAKSYDGEKAWPSINHSISNTIAPTHLEPKKMKRSPNQINGFSYSSKFRVVEPEWFASDPTPDPTLRKFRLRLRIRILFRIRQRWSPCAANSHFIRYNDMQSFWNIYRTYVKSAILDYQFILSEWDFFYLF